MKSIQEKREEVARLTRYANQLASDLADTRTQIRSLITDLGLPQISVVGAVPGSLASRPPAYGPKIPVEEALPDPWKTVRLHLQDGTSALGVWTGLAWWALGRRWHPTHWQPIISAAAAEEQHTAARAAG